MIIGYDIFGIVPFGVSNIPLSNAHYIEIKNSVIDEIHMQGLVTNNSQKESWTNGTVLLANFNGDLEAGNIAMAENPIDKIRVKRRNIENPNFIVLKELPFDPDPKMIEYKDYGVSSDETYEYIVTPVDMAGIEGIMTSISVNPKFDGWWLVDQDNPEEDNFQFIYNLDDVSINTDEDRTEIPTFAKHVKVYYGQRRSKRGALGGLFIPEGLSVRKQYEKLDVLLSKHKQLLLKNGYGRNFVVDVFAPSETLFARMKDVSKITLNWVEVGDYND